MELEKRVFLLERILKSVIDIFSETATPSQLDDLNELGRAANKFQEENKEVKDD